MINDQEKLLEGFGLATTPVCGAHKYRSEWLTLDTHFVKTLVMVFVVHFVCSLLVVSTKQCVNSISLEEQYCFCLFVCALCVALFHYLKKPKQLLENTSLIREKNF